MHLKRLISTTFVHPFTQQHIVCDSDLSHQKFHFPLASRSQTDILIRSLLHNALCCPIPSHLLNANRDEIVAGQAYLSELQKPAEGFCQSFEHWF